MTTTSRILTSCIVHDSIQRGSIKKPWLILAQHQGYLLSGLFIIVFNVVVFISHDKRHNMTTTSRKLTFYIVHNSIESDSIKKPW